jgi:hypothetical protein
VINILWFQAIESDVDESRVQTKPISYQNWIQY